MCLPLERGGGGGDDVQTFYLLLEASVGILHIHIHNKLIYAEIKDMGIR